MHQPPAVPDGHTSDEVAMYLRQLHAWAGGVPFRDLVDHVNAIRLARNVRETARQAVEDCFKRGRDRFDRDLVLDIARVLGADEARLRQLEHVCRVAGGRRPSVELADMSNGVPVGRADFTGREQLLYAAGTAVHQAWIDRRPPVVVFTGASGIGKTELAIQLAHRLISEHPNFNRQYFVDLHGRDIEIDPSTPGDVVAALLRLLGVRDSAIVTASTLDQRRYLLRRVLADQHTLLVLDNVADTIQFGQIVPWMPNCVVIATTRYPLALGDAAAGFDVGPLSFLSCVELLDGFDPAGRVGRESDVAVRLINELCGRRPFDLMALGGQLSDPDEASVSLADLADRLARFRFEETSHRILAGACHRLAPEARRVFRLLGLYPGFDFTAHDIAVLTDLDASHTDEYLRMLYERQLLLSRHADRYRMHGTVAAYARLLLRREESTTGQRAALRRLHAAATEYTAPQGSPGTS